MFSCMGCGSIRLLILFQRKDFLRFHSKFVNNLHFLLQSIGAPAISSYRDMLQSFKRKRNFRLFCYVVNAFVFIGTLLIAIIHFGGTSWATSVDVAVSIQFMSHFFSRILLDYFLHVSVWSMTLLLDNLPAISQNSKPSLENNSVEDSITKVKFQNDLQQNMVDKKPNSTTLYTLLHCLKNLEEHVCNSSHNEI